MKKLLVCLLTLMLAFTLCGPFTFADEAQTATTVYASEDSPTGYYVTFRLPDQDYGRVRLYAEWSFTDLNHCTRIDCENKTPDQWEDGDFVCCNGGSWQTNDMILNEDNVWEYTVPLPNGSYNYRFILGGSADAAVTDTTDTTMCWDPSNVPFHASFKDVSEYKYGDDFMSTIYVPRDTSRQVKSVDLTIEAPRDGENGTISYVVLDEEHAIQVYLPYGYDAAREGGYKVLYLAANAATNTWFGLGCAGKILDNAIADGKMDPVIAVCTAYSDYNVITDLYIPYIRDNYNVSAERDDWAITSYSASGKNSTYAIFDPDHFGWCAPMSTYANQGMMPEDADCSDPMIKGKHILHVQAMFETYWGPMLDEAPALLIGLRDNGVKVDACWPFGTHAWSVWREGLEYMCTDWLWK